MFVRSLIVIAALFATTTGCGKPPMMSVSGTVKLDGKAVSNCKVGFFPDTETFNPDRHGFGFGVTDPEGRFEIQHPQGEKGIWAGNYKVTFVAWVDAAGNPVPAESKPSEVEGGVKNLFPDFFEEPSRTTEKAVVKDGENIFAFNITSK
jgi:hypothetical protein